MGLIIIFNTSQFENKEFYISDNSIKFSEYSRKEIKIMIRFGYLVDQL